MAPCSAERMMKKKSFHWSRILYAALHSETFSSSEEEEEKLPGTKSRLLDRKQRMHVFEVDQ